MNIIKQLILHAIEFIRFSYKEIIKIIKKTIS